MPDYLVFDVTGNKNLEDGSPRLVKNAASEQEAVAVLLIDQYAYAQKFIVFKKASGTKINVEQARTVKEIDGADPTGTIVLSTYDEAALKALKASRAGL